MTSEGSQPLARQKWMAAAPTPHPINSNKLLPRGNWAPWKILHGHPWASLAGQHPLPPPLLLYSKSFLFMKAVFKNEEEGKQTHMV